MAIKSKRGALKRYDAIIRQCYRDMAGGLQFGMDWATLRITYPDRYAEIQALRAMFHNLPE